MRGHPVYLAVRRVDYEGCAVLGVYESRIDAEKAVEYAGPSYGSMSYEVEERFIL